MVSLEVPSTAARDLALVAFVEDDTGVLQALQLPLASLQLDPAFLDAVTGRLRFAAGMPIELQ